MYSVVHFSYNSLQCKPNVQLCILFPILPTGALALFSLQLPAFWGKVELYCRRLGVLSVLYRIYILWFTHSFSELFGRTLIPPHRYSEEIFFNLSAALRLLLPHISALSGRVLEWTTVYSHPLCQMN